MSSDGANFAGLVTSIARIHALFAAQASKAINVSLTLRNWLIGHHIAEYELQGADRADYGGRLLERLAQQLGEAGLRRIDARELRRFRQFYGAYPQIREAVTPVLAALPVAQRFGLPEIRESVTPESESVAPAGTSTGTSTLHALDPRLLLERLSFTHFAELVQIDAPLKRQFYEVEILRCGHPGCARRPHRPPARNQRHPRSHRAGAVQVVVRRLRSRSRQAARPVAGRHGRSHGGLVSGQLRGVGVGVGSEGLVHALHSRGRRSGVRRSACHAARSIRRPYLSGHQEPHRHGPGPDGHEAHR
ncbi:MAG: hypothetical protein IPP44_28485 [Ideonella sp.]|nr:hypothetical protein [Ideonella sp.]